MKFEEMDELAKTDTIVTSTFEVGRLYFSFVRDFVSQCKFHGHDVTLWESSGWFSKTMKVKGPWWLLRQLGQKIIELEKENP